jgi:hypothetical protein
MLSVSAITSIDAVPLFWVSAHHDLGNSTSL